MPMADSEEQQVQTPEASAYKVQEGVGLIFDPAAAFQANLEEQTKARAPEPTSSHESEEVEGEEAETTEVETAAPKSRAEKRIRQLANEKKELQAKLGELSQFQQQFQQMQAQFQHLQQQAQEREAKLLEAFTRVSPQTQAQAQDLPPEDPIERVKWEAVREAEAKFMSKLSEFEKREQEREAQRREKVEQLKRLQEQKAWHNRMMTETESALSSVFTDFDPEDAQRLKQLGAGENLLIASNVYGQLPSEAAAKFKEFLDNYADARERAKAKKNVGPMARSRSVPAPAGATRSVGASEAFLLQRQNEPSMAELRKQGFSSKLDWRIAQRRSQNL